MFFSRKAFKTGNSTERLNPKLASTDTCRHNRLLPALLSDRRHTVWTRRYTNNLQKKKIFQGVYSIRNTKRYKRTNINNLRCVVLTYSVITVCCTWKRINAWPVRTERILIAGNERNGSGNDGESGTSVSGNDDWNTKRFLMEISENHIHFVFFTFKT